MRLSIALMFIRLIAPARMCVGTMLGATLNIVGLMDTDILTPTRTTGTPGDIITTIGHGDGRPIVMESGPSSLLILGPPPQHEDKQGYYSIFFIMQITDAYSRDFRNCQVDRMIFGI